MPDGLDLAITKPPRYQSEALLAHRAHAETRCQSQAFVSSQPAARAGVMGAC